MVLPVPSSGPDTGGDCVHVGNRVARNKGITQLPLLSPLQPTESLRLMEETGHKEPKPSLESTDDRKQWSAKLLFLTERVREGMKASFCL